MKDVENKKTVWMVASGSYSDYGVDGIFSTKESAQDYIDAFTSEYTAEFHPPLEMEIDPGNTTFHKMGRVVYNLCISREGNTSDIRRYDNNTLRNNEFVAGYCHSKPELLIVTCWATDEKHAAKIANEIRVQKIANGEWGHF